MHTVRLSSTTSGNCLRRYWWFSTRQTATNWAIVHVMIQFKK